jgi:hypothetical protein
MVSPLITQGMGPNSRLITNGLGGFIGEVIEVAQRVRRVAGNGIKWLRDEIAVYVKLLRVNKVEVVNEVASQTLHFIDQKKVVAEHVETKKMLDDVNIIIEHRRR